MIFTPAAIQAIRSIMTDHAGQFLNAVPSLMVMVGSDEVKIGTMPLYAAKTPPYDTALVFAGDILVLNGLRFNKVQSTKGQVLDFQVNKGLFLA